MGYLGQPNGMSVFRRSPIQGQGLVFLTGHVLGSAHQSQGGAALFNVAHPYATSPCMVRRPTGNKPGIEPSDQRILRRSAPASNTLGLDNIVWAASRVAFCDASAGGRQQT